MLSCSLQCSKKKEFKWSGEFADGIHINPYLEGKYYFYFEDGFALSVKVIRLNGSISEYLYATI
jgi:hypothetical protein